jgi:membrane-associated phospholipid phosphatase
VRLVWCRTSAGDEAGFLCSDERTDADVNRPTKAEGRRRRAWLAMAGLALLALVLLLGFGVGSGSTDPDRDVRRVLREPLDERPYRMVVRILASETGWPHASYLTALLPLALAGAVLARDIWARRQDLRLTRWRWLLLLVSAVPMQHLLRVGFDRAGPNVPLWSDGGKGAYPSGAALLVALGWAIGVVVLSDLRPRWRPVLLVAAAVGLGLHGWARVAAHKHWASDILGSYLLVGAVLLLAATSRSRVGLR